MRPEHEQNPLGHFLCELFDRYVSDEPPTTLNIIAERVFPDYVHRRRKGYAASTPQAFQGLFSKSVNSMSFGRSFSIDEFRSVILHTLPSISQTEYDQLLSLCNQCEQRDRQKKPKPQNKPKPQLQADSCTLYIRESPTLKEFLYHAIMRRGKTYQRKIRGAIEPNFSHYAEMLYNQWRFTETPVTCSTFIGTLRSCVVDEKPFPEYMKKEQFVSRTAKILRLSTDEKKQLGVLFDSAGQVEKREPFGRSR